jgi:hypothetical membrane protein
MVAIAATVYFLAAAVATHIVSPQYDLIRDYISDYVIGPYGWIYSSAFLASGIGAFALAAALWRTVPSAAASRVGFVLLVIVGLTYLLDFWFPTDILAPGEPPQTQVGQIHLAAAFFGWAAFVVAAFLITTPLKHAQAFAGVHAILLLLSWLTLALLVLLVVTVVAKLPVGGLVEKLFILVRNIWALILAVTVLRASSSRLASPSSLRL